MTPGGLTAPGRRDGNLGHLGQIFDFRVDS